MGITHKVQLIILTQLLYRTKARFRDLNVTDLDNNHFNFHLQKLLKQKVIEKKGIYYLLTPKGMETAGRIDTRRSKVIIQPKISVFIVVRQKRQVLLGKRLKDPGKGKVSFFTRKVHFDESLYETATRCLRSEAGLEAEFRFCGVVHFKYYLGDDLKELALLNVFKASHIKGDLEVKTLETENFWIDEEKLGTVKNLFFGTKAILSDVVKGMPFYRELSTFN